MKDSPLSQADKVAAQENIDNIGSELVRTAVNDFISPSLGLEVKSKSRIKKEVPEWITTNLDSMQ